MRENRVWRWIDTVETESHESIEIDNLASLRADGRKA